MQKITLLWDRIDDVVVGISHIFTVLVHCAHTKDHKANYASTITKTLSFDFCFNRSSFLPRGLPLLSTITAVVAIDVVV